MHLRPFTPTDYPALASIHNAIYPQRPRTAEGWAQTDQQRSPKCLFQRWVVEEDGRVIATGAYDQDITDYAPDRFYVDFKVLPEYQRRGVGGALYEHVMAALAPFNPSVLRANAYADQPQGLEFMLRRGFFEAWRETPVRLELGALDLAPYQHLEGALRQQGIHIVSLAELAGDPGLEHKLYDLFMTIIQTLPREENSNVDTLSFEDWRPLIFDHPEVNPDGYFIATYRQPGEPTRTDYIGLKELGVDLSSGMLWAGLMGVLPEYRRRGIGMAMQVRAIAWGRGAWIFHSLEQHRGDQRSHAGDFRPPGLPAPADLAPVGEGFKGSGLFLDMSVS